MKSFKNHLFSDIVDRDSFELFQNILFENCEFKNCQLSQTENPENRSTIRNIEIEDCSAMNNCSPGCAIFENIEIDNLQVDDQLKFLGAVFKHVFISGNVGSFYISNDIGSSASDAIRKSFSTANAKYYESVDWALDISRANFTEVEIWGIPSNLIIYDYKSQRLITKENVKKINWEKLSMKGNKFRLFLDKMLKEGYDDIVLIAPRLSNDFEDLLHDLDALTDAGYTEPEERMMND
jgi:hypothetical protein